MPETHLTLIPHLCCRNAAEAAAFYQRAFGAETLGVLKADDGRVMHATLSLGGAIFYMNDEFIECGGKSPLALGGTPVTMHLQVADCDAAFARAVEAGCEIVMPLEDMFWGDRYGRVRDPYGHEWSVATTKVQVSPEELNRAVAGMALG